MARKAKYRCDCGHSLSFHNPGDGQCYAADRRPKSHTDLDHDGSTVWHREYTYEDVPCMCQRYVGKVPKGTAARTPVLERMLDERA